MKIGPDDLVLDVGSGHNPNPRSDILCDRYIEDNTERGGAIRVDRGRHLRLPWAVEPVHLAARAESRSPSLCPLPGHRLPRHLKVVCERLERALRRANDHYAAGPRHLCGFPKTRSAWVDG